MDGFANMGYDDSHQIGGAGMSERIASDWNDDYDFPPSVVAAVSINTHSVAYRMTQCLLMQNLMHISIKK